MARGWLGAGILVAFLVLGLVLSGAADKVHLPTGELLDRAAELTLAGDLEAGIALGAEAKNRWETQWFLTAAVADHAPMDDVDALFGEMEIYARTGEAPHFAACCKELAQRIQAVADAHRFTWWNIL